MSDLTLNINGNASGASAAFREAGGAVEGLGDDVGKSVVKWQELAAITKKAVEMVVKFGIDAVKAYAESERVQKQLTRAAGEYADALGEQAEALSKKYAVDDDIIKQSQVLLTQWGGVGAATEDVTKAVLNYAAATGQDAVSATSDLIRNVESGGVGLAKMGVHFTATGQKGKDLAAAVSALNKKFGGAAAADAESLTGSMHAASLAFEDLQKDLGESIAGFLQETGAVGALTTALRSLQEFMGQKQTNKLFDEGFRMGEWVNAQKKLVDMQNELAAAKRDGAAPSILALFEEDVRNAQAAVDKLKASAAPLVPGLGDVTGVTNKGRKDAAAAPDVSGVTKYILEETSATTDAMAEQSVAIMKADEENARALAEQQTAADAEAAQRRKLAEDGELRAAQEAYAQQRRLQEDHLRQTLAMEQKWQDAGGAIGAAFVDSFSRQLERLMAGEDLDAGEVMASVLADVLAVAGQVIGGIVGGYAGNVQLGAAVGGAVGNLAGTGVKALARSGKTKKYHEGGWVGDEAELPRYHSGGWVNPNEQVALLRKGERVATPEEVQNAGGRAALDASLSGRGGAPQFSVTVQAIDAVGVRQFFENDGGRGFFNALRTGRGSLGSAFGGG